jgi:hypothetical protein
MTISATLPVKQSNVKTEYGGAGALNLRTFLLGGGYVANNWQNRNIANTGTITLKSFAGSMNVFATNTCNVLGITTSTSKKQGSKSRAYAGSYTGNTAASGGALSAIPPVRNFGNVSNANVVGVSRSNTAIAPLLGIYDTASYIVNNGNNQVSYVVFSGNLVNWAWSAITANGVTMTRTNTVTPAGTYLSTNNSTYWSQANVGGAGKGFFRQGAGTTSQPSSSNTFIMTQTVVP